MKSENTKLLSFVLTLILLNKVKSCYDENCADCANNNFRCEECKNGFYLSSGSCYHCIDFCNKCSNNYECEDCEIFYKTDDNKQCETDTVLLIYVAFLLGFIGGSAVCYMVCCLCCQESQRKRRKEKREQRKEERRRVREFRRNLRENRDGGEQQQRRNPHPIFSEENRRTAAANLHRGTGEVFGQPQPQFDSIFEE